MRSGFGHNARGNPYSGAGSQWAPPPKPPTARKPPPPSAGAQRYKNFETPKASAYQNANEGAGARKSTYEAWEHMRNQKSDPSSRAEPRRRAGRAPPQPGPEDSPGPSKSQSRPPSAFDEFGGSNSERPSPRRSQSTNSPKKNGFSTLGGGDEPPAPRGSYYTQPRAAPEPPPRNPVPPTQRPNLPPRDNLQVPRPFIPTVEVPYEARQSAPYAAHGGEKLNPFDNVSPMSRSKSQRERSERPDLDEFVPRTSSDSNFFKSKSGLPPRPGKPYSHPVVQDDGTSSDDDIPLANSSFKRSTPSTKMPAPNTPAIPIRPRAKPKAGNRSRTNPATPIRQQTPSVPFHRTGSQGKADLSQLRDWSSMNERAPLNYFSQGPGESAVNSDPNSMYAKFQAIPVPQRKSLLRSMLHLSSDGREARLHEVLKPMFGSKVSDANVGVRRSSKEALYCFAANPSPQAPSSSFGALGQSNPFGNIGGFYMAKKRESLFDFELLEEAAAGSLKADKKNPNPYVANDDEKVSIYDMLKESIREDTNEPISKSKTFKSNGNSEGDMGNLRPLTDNTNLNGFESTQRDLLDRLVANKNNSPNDIIPGQDFLKKRSIKAARRRISNCKHSDHRECSDQPYADAISGVAMSSGDSGSAKKRTHDNDVPPLDLGTSVKPSISGSSLRDVRDADGNRTKASRSSLKQLTLSCRSSRGSVKERSESKWLRDCPENIDAKLSSWHSLQSKHAVPVQDVLSHSGSSAEAFSLKSPRISSRFAAAMAAMTSRPIWGDADAPTSFSFNINDDTFKRTENPMKANGFVSPGADNINTKFTPEDWEGKFCGSTYFEPDPKATRVPNAQRTRTQSGSRPRGRSPPKPSGVDGKAPKMAPSPPAEPQQSESATSVKFTPEAWQDTFKTQTFMPPPRSGTTPSPPKKSRSTFARPRASNAGADSETSEEQTIFTGRGKESAQFPASAANPDAMDVDTPPPAASEPVAAATTQSTAPTNDPHKRRAATRSSSPISDALHRDFEELGLADLLSLLALPPAPIAPSSPGSPGIERTPTSYETYATSFKVYMHQWDIFYNRFMLHLVARKGQNDNLADERFLDNRGLETYRRGMKEDRLVLAHWIEAGEKHQNVLKEWAVNRDRMVRGEYGGELDGRDRKEREKIQKKAH